MDKEKYIELQVLDQQIKNIQKQLQMIDDQMIELIITRQSIDELKDVKLKSEILSPIASGIFVKSDIKDNNEFIVNVGSNVAVKKTREEVKELIEKQLYEIKNVQNELLVNLQKMVLEAQNIEKELQNV